MEDKHITKVSVRNLVEFILREGDIDNRNVATMDREIMQKGSRVHRKIQKRMGSNYRAEVPLSITLLFDEIEIKVEGRADGIIEKSDGIVIDEIKGVQKDLSSIKEPPLLHLAQARCYGYIYARDNELDSIKIQVTYCQLETEEIKRFLKHYEYRELEEWFMDLMNRYEKWARLAYEWRIRRNESIRKVDFPFPYREGQKDVVTSVYRTIQRKKKLFIQAPTGVGKTVATIFPTVKAVGEELGEKIFYLTAKTIARTAAEQTFDLLIEAGLEWKSLTLTAKEKVCFYSECNCNPDYCVYAKGHYDRINHAIYDMITSDSRMRREDIENQAIEHQVCPFELAVDLTLWADGVICDYNYVFDPNAYLKRFFSSGVRGDYLFLIDEAHNLVERGRNMYSATIYKEDVMAIRRLVKELSPRLSKSLGECNKQLLALKKECERWQIQESVSHIALKLMNVLTEFDLLFERMRNQGNEPREKDYGDAPDEDDTWNIPTEIQGDGKELKRDSKRLEEDGIGSEFALAEEVARNVPVGIQGNTKEIEEDSKGLAEDKRKKMLEFYFQVRHFLAIHELLDENYTIYTEHGYDGRFSVKLFCINPATNLQRFLEQGNSTIFFSATLLPIHYYKELLSVEKDDYAIYADSIFPKENRKLIIGSDVSTKYTKRSPRMYREIAGYILEVAKGKVGNYIAFFPSYKVMEEVCEFFTELASSEASSIDWVVQSQYMREEAREIFLENFEEDNENSLVGFCVMGGIFSEGIDLKEERLIGAIVVGTGLPQVCNEREILKGYFDSLNMPGFDYSYLYPGMNKVLQAAGRVIRTENDRGVIVLLDERFLQRQYQEVFPREWQEYQVCRRNNLQGYIKEFWDE
jgi:Rad3-related DNA helicase